MKLSSESHTLIMTTLQKALERYASGEGKNIITDFHLQPNMQTGELLVMNDDEEVLASVVLDEWVSSNPEDFYIGCEVILKKVLNKMADAGMFASLSVMKPYSFVLIDGEKETLAELRIVDEDETLFLSDELLKGLDEELNAFLKDLLEK